MAEVAEQLHFTLEFLGMVLAALGVLHLVTK
jgi:hypothetical protein